MKENKSSSIEMSREISWTHSTFGFVMILAKYLYVQKRKLGWALDLRSLWNDNLLVLGLLWFQRNVLQQNGNSAVFYNTIIGHCRSIQFWQEILYLSIKSVCLLETLKHHKNNTMFELFVFLKTSHGTIQYMPCLTIIAELFFLKVFFLLDLETCLPLVQTQHKWSHWLIKSWLSLLFSSTCLKVEHFPNNSTLLHFCSICESLNCIVNKHHIVLLTCSWNKFYCYKKCIYQ